MKEYQYVFNRLKKLEKTIENLIKQNIDLKESNYKLRRDHETFTLREEARERVLRSLVPEEQLPT